MVKLTDNAAAIAEKPFSISIAAVVEAARPEVWVDVQAYRAIVNYRLAGLDYGTSCTVDLLGDSYTDTSTQTTGPARRSALFTNLNSNLVYSAVVSCTTVTPSERVYFTMPSAPAAGDRTIPFNLRPSAILPTTARVTVDWDWDTTFADPTSTQNTSCSTGCTVNVTFPQQGVFYYRWRWQTSGDAVIATSAVQPIVIP
jgi:cellulase/cellobiase CelA1